MVRGPRGRAGATAAVVAAIVVLAGCGKDADPSDLGGANPDGSVTISDPRIHESSGLAASDRHPGYFYTLNDMGNSPEVFLLRADGSTAAVLTLRGATNNDWEDLAVADGRVYVGDIGGGKTDRSTIDVLVFDEPEELVDSSPSWSPVELTYPDGAHNAEALLVHPGTDRIYIVTKDPLDGGIYAAPRDPGSGDNELERVADAPPVVTSGAFAPTGDMFALRNEKKAFLFVSLGLHPRVIDLPESPQGESLTWVGDTLLVGSEGIGSTIYTVPLSKDLLEDLREAAQ
jgi:hypothetical protein